MIGLVAQLWIWRHAQSTSDSVRHWRIGGRSFQGGASVLSHAMNAWLVWSGELGGQSFGLCVMFLKSFLWCSGAHYPADHVLKLKKTNSFFIWKKQRKCKWVIYYYFLVTLLILWPKSRHVSGNVCGVEITGLCCHSEPEQRDFLASLLPLYLMSVFELYMCFSPQFLMTSVQRRDRSLKASGAENKSYCTTYK